MSKVSIGDAIYRQGAMIQISNFDDWEWYYKNQEEGLTLLRIKIRKVKNYSWDLLGLRGYHWQVEIVKVDGVEISEDNITIYDVHEINGYPYSFKLSIKVGDRTIDGALKQQVNRISGTYYNSQYAKNGSVEMNDVKLVPESGYYESLLFFMIGANNSGKTCWLHALNTKKNRNRAINQYRELSGNELEYRGGATPSDRPLEPTSIDKITFNDFLVKNKKGESCLAFIVDISGEMNQLRGDNEDDTNKRTMIQESVKQYASGVFVVRSRDWLFEEETEKARECDPFQIIRELRQGNNGLREEDFCYIMTGADRILKDIVDDPEKFDNLAPDSPIFRQIESLKEIDRLRAIATSIIGGEHGDAAVTGDSPCFVVSCCSDTVNENGENMLDFKKGYNVELPFVYVLNFYTKK